MGQDLNKMMSVFIDGIEEVRVVDTFVLYGPDNDLVPVPVLTEGEYYFISERGFPIIVTKDDLFPTKGFC